MPSPKTTSLLHTKLQPPRLPPGLIERERLLARLDGALTRKVSLLSAPTGFGKTTLVRTWIASCEVPSAWVTLDEHDNDPVQFWTYICSALRILDPYLGKATLSMLTGPQPPSFRMLLTPLVNDLTQLEAPSVLVVDEYHAIKSTDIHNGVSFLIQNLPESLHLIFITRTDPNLPLGLLRARDELLEINTSDLRFNQQEAEAFLQTTAGADLSTSAVARLLQKTETNSRSLLARQIGFPDLFHHRWKSERLLWGISPRQAEFPNLMLSKKGFPYVHWSYSPL